MRKVILMLAMMLPMFVMSSCSDDEDNSFYMEQLSGIWVEYDNTLGYEVFHIELRPDGTGEQWAEDYGVVDEYGKQSFTWSAGESTITVTIEGEGTLTMNYRLEDGMLVLTYEDETIRYVRK